MINKQKAAFQAALPFTIPVFTGYIVLAIAFGILMNSSGMSLLWTLVASIFVYAGSMQFLTVSLLAMGFDPFYTFLMTIAVNARHLFYGVSLLQKFHGTGKLKPYLIFSLTDETFSLLCDAEPPKHVDNKWFMFFVSLLNHSYWIIGSLIGHVLNSMITFNTKGIDFVLTALFVVILINQWQSTSNHLPAIIGIVSAVLCRILFDASTFIIPSMIIILLSVMIFKKPLERREKHELH